MLAECRENVFSRAGRWTGAPQEPGSQSLLAEYLHQAPEMDVFSISSRAFR